VVSSDLKQANEKPPNSVVLYISLNIEQQIKIYVDVNEFKLNPKVLNSEVSLKTLHNNKLR